jgi:hypothetical protein
MAYKRPLLEVTDIGPHKSTNTLSKRLVAFIPSRKFGTGVRACLPRMQWSHFGGAVERLTGIPFTTLVRAISMIVRVLQ